MARNVQQENIYEKKTKVIEKQAQPHHITVIYPCGDKRVGGERCKGYNGELERCILHFVISMPILK